MRKSITVGIVAAIFVMAIGVNASAFSWHIVQQHPEIQMKHPGVQLIVDTDSDGIPDASDPDDDNDGIPDVDDNCSLDFNSTILFIDPITFQPVYAPQLDADNDGVGDVCDNCFGVANAGQEDSDDDDIGDACDLDDPAEDTDGDGVLDPYDNCVNDSNPAQENEDGDEFGDACDDDFGVDTDGDGLLDDEDDCPTEVGSEENFGCPDADAGLDLDNDVNGVDSDGGSCSMVPATTVNPLLFLLISAGFIPVAIRRKK